MFEIVHEVLRISAWTGLSAGAVVALGAVAWFVAPLRWLAISAALTVAAAYGGTLYGNHVGRADVQKAWEAANEHAASEATARDAAIATDLETKYAPLIEAAKKQAETYEHQLLASKSSSAAGCELGADALRLRRRSK